ncbi:MAG TPA: hypothetical protein VG411_09485 [Actinomycetota bacterium]|nr:hypothetical protein [Actinomycetota bacterium]
MTRLGRLDGPATAAISEQLVDVYRAAMGAPPFHETEVEAGFFADELAGELEEPGFRCWVASEDDRVVGFAYGYETPQVPSGGWYGLLRNAVGRGRTAPAAGWRGSSPSCGSPSAPNGAAAASAGPCWSACSPAPAPTGPG